VASKPKTMQEAIEIATELMDKKIRTFAERETASKRKFENTSRNTQNQQQHSNKRQNTGQVYTAASGEKKQYSVKQRAKGSLRIHQETLRTNNNTRTRGKTPAKFTPRHLVKRSNMVTANTNNANNQRALGQARNQDVMSVEFKDILKENVLS
nr:hypothetical protein [Tanacetum cinerariifolium]